MYHFHTSLLSNFFAKDFLFVKEMREAGSSYRGIAKFLNEGGYKSRNGGKWHPSSVKYLLDRLEKVCG